MSQFNFRNLDNETRDYMMEEYNFSLNNNSLYRSKSFNNKGIEIYPELLKKSIKLGDEETLTEDLKGLFNDTEYYERDGKRMERKVSADANTRLARGEFNRFYIRGLCARAISEGIGEVEIYRARESSQRRTESDLKIGNKVSAEKLLDDLRNNIEPKILPEINSGLSIFVDSF